MHLTKNTSATLDSNNVALITGPSSGQNLAIGRSSIQARNNGATYTLYLNEYGGGINVGSSEKSSNTQGVIKICTTTTTADDLPSILQMSIKDTTTGKTYTDNVIAAYQDHGSTPYGFNLRIGCGGNTVVGAGESSANLYAAILKGNTGENLYLTADGASYLYSNANTVANRVGIKMDTAGNILPQKAEADNNGVSNLGSTSNRFKEAYFTNLLRIGAASSTAVSTTANNLCLDTTGIYYDTINAGTSYGYFLRGKGVTYANLYVSTMGDTANTPGITILQLGNATASTAANNSNGTLLLYSNTTKYTSIKSSLEITGNHLNYLPVYSATGTSTYYGRLVGIYKGTTAGSTGFSDVGSSTKPVYITANGVATAISYTIEKSVPSNAVFTDTNTKVTSVDNHYTPSANANSALTANASGASAAWSIDVVKGITISRDAKGHVTGVGVTSGKIPANPNTDAMFHYYNSSAVSTAHWITTNITASSTGTTFVRGRIFGSKGTNSPAIVVFAADFVKINDPTDGTTSVTLRYWDPLGLFSSFNAAFDSNKKVYFQFKYSTRYSRIEAIINHDATIANEIASISTTAPTVQATYSGTKVTS